MDIRGRRSSREGAHTVCHDGKEGSAGKALERLEHGLGGWRVGKSLMAVGQALSRGEAKILRGCLVY